MPERSRQARWLQTRAQILDGAVEVLVRHGYAGLTMQRVQDAAGVTRGALTHHFPSMAELAAVAVEAVADRQTDALREELARRRRGAPDVEQFVDALLDLMRRPTFLAGLELWGAARTDDALRAALVPGARRTGRVHREVASAVLGLDPGSPDAALAVDGLLSLLRGLALGGVLRPHSDAERAVLMTWLGHFDQHRASGEGATPVSSLGPAPS